MNGERSKKHIDGLKERNLWLHKADGKRKIEKEIGVKK